MSVLLSSAYRTRRGARWGLVAYTAISFSFVTIFTAANLDIQSISYIDNREFPGTDQQPPGPLGYQYLIYSAPLSIVGNLMFVLNNWLADGLLASSAYYSIFGPPITNNFCSSIVATFFTPGDSGSSPSQLWCTSPLWVRFSCNLTATPTAHIIDTAMGIMLIYQTSQPDSSIWNTVAINFGIPYFSISLSLNIILTLLIVARLGMHSKNIRSAMGAPAGASGLYETIITVLIESCALYAVTSLLFVAPWGAKSHVADIFLPILAEIQVRTLFVSSRDQAGFLTLATNRSSLRC